MPDYDYIIAGTGAAGLILAYRIYKDDYFKNKRILLIEKDQKNANDRTWCYWENGKGEWDDLIDKSWDNIIFRDETFSKIIPLGQYKYKMLRSKALYSFIYNEIKNSDLFDIVNEEVEEIKDLGDSVVVKTNSGIYSANKAFSSLFNPEIIKSSPEYAYLKQHFIGWFVQFDEPAFEVNQATFMDFSVKQKGNTRFMYILPVSTNEALIEYTLFSEDLLTPDSYEAEIINYLAEKGINQYTIKEKEQGNIPMTCYPFYKQNTENILYIGSAGGWTKASTGYTFAKITKTTLELIKFLKKEKDFKKFHHFTRYWLYDLIFLDVLYRNNDVGSAVFSSIFKRNQINEIFSFLDEEGTILNDIKIIFNTRPKWNFVKSAFRAFLIIFK